MTRDMIEQNLSTRLLAKQFATRIREVGARKVLVTSVERGAGKSTFVGLLRRESNLLKIEKFSPLVTRDHYTSAPENFEGELLIIDGPAFLEEEGLYVLPEQWLIAIDAAVVIVSLRETRTVDLKKTVQWLTDYGVEHVFLVCNMKEISPLMGSLSIKRSRPRHASLKTGEVNNG